jgi:hypothetical protein
MPFRCSRAMWAPMAATGVSTASVMGTSYPGAGASVGPSFLWGYIAAKSAAAEGAVTQSIEAERPAA